MSGTDASKYESVAKRWGMATTLYRDDLVEIVRIEVVKGGYCSRHKHERKDNAFLVLSGMLGVETERRSGLLLSAGSEPLLVRAGVIHQFEAVNEVAAVEIYRAVQGCTVDPLDIIRYSEGGIKRK